MIKSEKEALVIKRVHFERLEIKMSDKRVG